MTVPFFSRWVLAGVWLLAANALPASARADDQEAAAQSVVEAPVEESAQVDGEGFVDPKPGQDPHHPRGGWYLGVYGSYSASGLVLTEVHAGTPAARAGLEVGDRIVTVNGHQIGVVVGRRLQLDVALQRYASRTGGVRLLVQDHRTQRLLNVDVQLSRGRVHLSM